MRQFLIRSICAIFFFIAVSMPTPAAASGGIPWWFYAVVVIAGLGAGSSAGYSIESHM